ENDASSAAATAHGGDGETGFLDEFHGDSFFLGQARCLLHSERRSALAATTVGSQEAEGSIPSIAIVDGSASPATVPAGCWYQPWGSRDDPGARTLSTVNMPPMSM